VPCLGAQQHARGDESRCSPAAVEARQTASGNAGNTGEEGALAPHALLVTLRDLGSALGNSRALSEAFAGGPFLQAPHALLVPSLVSANTPSLKANPQLCISLDSPHALLVTLRDLGSALGNSRALSEAFAGGPFLQHTTAPAAGSAAKMAKRLGKAPGLLCLQFQ